VGAVYGNAGVQAPFVYPVALRFERVDAPAHSGDHHLGAARWRAAPTCS
jgi:hypothetical protein